MKVTKVALLESINSALDKHDQAVKDWQAAVIVWRERQAAKWQAEKAPQWKALRDLLTKKLNKGQPVTQKDIEGALTTRSSTGYRSFYLSDFVFTPDQTPSGAITVNGVRVSPPTSNYVADLRALKLFLEGSPDESFSLESLSRLGFKAPAFVFRAAVS